MTYCKFRADQLFTGTEILNKDYVLVTSEKGTVLDIIYDPYNDTPIRKGILSPGFVNCHCHLELSHTKGLFTEKTGLPGFIAQVMKQPAVVAEERQLKMESMVDEMHQLGISAVGDISNLPDSAIAKQRGKIEWYTFLELINLNDANITQKLEDMRVMEQSFDGVGRTAISPHAVYSVSPSTMEVINKVTAGKTITIHNQESRAENQLMEQGSGPFLQFYKSIGLQKSPISATGKTGLQSWLPHFNNAQTIVSVHNTYISQEDVDFVRNYQQNKNVQVVYCLCPNANLFIENQLPPVTLLQNEQVVIGTDSIASNWQLSVAAELKTIHQHFPAISRQQLLQWATLNGARALGFQQLGSFKKGATPGIILLSADFGQVERLGTPNE